MPRIQTGTKGANTRWGFNTIPTQAGSISIPAPASANVSSAGTQPILIYQLITSAAAQSTIRSPFPDQRVLLNITGGSFGAVLYATDLSGPLPTSGTVTSTIFEDVALSVTTAVINLPSTNFVIKARAYNGRTGNLTDNFLESTNNTDDIRFNNTSPSTSGNPWFAYRYAMVPAQPGAPSVSFSGNTASISWNAPDNGEAVINSYIVQYASNSSFSGASAVNTGTSTSTNIGPLSSGTWWFRVYATNVVGSSQISGSTSGVSPSPLAVWTTTAFTEIARIGTSYTKTVVATGIRATNPYELVGGSTVLPGGLTFSASTGTITGTPSNGVSQTFNFTVNAYNVDNVATASQTFTLNRRQRLPVWNDTTLARPRVGTQYDDAVTATNAGTINAYSVSGLPANGLSFNTNTGAITGTPTSTSSISLIITVKNSDGDSSTDPSDTLSFTLIPNARLAVWRDQILTTTTVRVNQSYTDGVVADNAVSYALQTPNTLPPGITLNTGTGAITGTPTTPGTYNFRVVASNASDPAETITTGQLSILVEPAAGGAVWSGSAWVPSVFKVWNGAAWVEQPVKVWNGTAWVDPIS